MESLHNLWRIGHRSGWRQRGFTLTELVMVIAIIGILAAIGLPGVMRSQAHYRLKGAARDLMGNFNKAKLEAVRRGANVVIAFSLNPVNRYQIFVDDGAGANAENLNPDADEAIIATVQLPQGIAISQTDFGVAGGTKTGYSPRGLPLPATLPLNLNTANQSGALLRIVGDNSLFMLVTFSSAGRVQLQKSTTGALGSFVY